MPRPPRRCAPCPGGAKVAIKNATVVVYSVRKRVRYSGSRHLWPGRAWIACSKTAGKRVSLGFVPDEPCGELDSVERTTVAGSYLAYVTTKSDCTGETGDAFVNLIDLNAAREGFTTGATSRSEPSSVTVTALALRADDALAWITN